MSRFRELINEFRNPKIPLEYRALCAVRMVECAIHWPPMIDLTASEIREATECIDAFKRMEPEIGVELWLYWNRRDHVLRAGEHGAKSYVNVVDRLRLIKRKLIGHLHRYSAG